MRENFIIGNRCGSVKHRAAVCYAVGEEFAHTPGLIARRVRTRKLARKQSSCISNCKDLERHIRDFLRQQYQVELAKIVVEQPPKVEMGEYALPLSFELAKRLRKAPRKIAEEIVAELAPLEGFDASRSPAPDTSTPPEARRGGGEAMREREPVVSGPRRTNGAGRRAAARFWSSTPSINPNKAAHIGHLRNAILGDTFVRLLRAAGHEVDVQNYIDNTGVQVADVVVGFTQLEQANRGREMRELIAECASADNRDFDYYCWDLYAQRFAVVRAGQGEPSKARRLETLHAIEQGGNETAEIAELISTAVLRRHLETMERLDIEYDFLPRESEILRLHFWEPGLRAAQRKKGSLLRDRRARTKAAG